MYVCMYVCMYILVLSGDAVGSSEGSRTEQRSDTGNPHSCEGLPTARASPGHGPLPGTLGSHVFGVVRVYMCTHYMYIHVYIHTHAYIPLHMHIYICLLIKESSPNRKKTFYDLKTKALSASGSKYPLGHIEEGHRSLYTSHSSPSIRSMMLPGLPEST